MKSLRKRPSKKEYKKLLERIKEAEEEKLELRKLIDSYRNMLAKMQIDFDSFRKRVERDKEIERAMASERIIREILPVLDNLEHAANASLDSNGNASIANGIKMILRQLLNVLAKEGLEVVPTVGSEFDPSIHEAVEVIPIDSDEEDGKVILEVRKGYTLGGRVIRPALVKVGKKG
ncbi:MAG: nucleotide exchange factor GrpE [Synergistetes bacterium]|nr:nucleotide exchange factor GrpE [Synergistota bacterium]MCX8128363.1 nucleotide exchange factor GrpE [Synergistota bacterium]MDW8192979.1 nucleotide exchange factor GrpE [Synergistota bacterium]